MNGCFVFSKQLIIKPFAVFLGFLAFGFGSSPIQKTETLSPELWGFFAHKKINRLAVYTLPPGMMVFFKKNIDWVAEHATDADTRRYSNPLEAPRHFIDLDVYGSHAGQNLPRNFTDALIRFSEIRAIAANGDTVQLFGNQVLALDSIDVGLPKPEVFFRWTKPPIAAWKDSTTLRFSAKNFRSFFQRTVLFNFYQQSENIDADSVAAFLKSEGYDFRPRKVFFRESLSEHGILPWHLQKMQRDLTEAFRQKDSRRILRLAADIGHYIGDAHVPLHTCSNYNGQKTGQEGIHAFWESRIPELFADEQYDFFVGKPNYVEDPTSFFWNTILESNLLTDSVLRIEKNLRHSFPSDQQTCPEMRGQVLKITQCREFSEAYQSALDGMVERRMRAAILAVASCWFTAWVDAGQPDLTTMDVPPPPETEEKEAEEMRKMLEAGKILGRPEEH